MPTVWLPLLDYLRTSGRSVAPLNRTVIGGSACPLSMIEEFRDRHGVAVLHGWGMTEMSRICSGYYRLEEGSDAHGPDGWFDTGDVATIDTNGYIKITDRAKDVIKSGGE